MAFNTIPKGEKIFIDANIFIYHFTGASKQCRDLLDDCSRRTFDGFTSTHILAKTCHRLMAAEALSLGLVSGQQPSAKLQKNPAAVRKLSSYFSQVSAIFEWNMTILTLEPHDIIKSQSYRQRYGLLTNDSLVLALMQRLGITNLISADTSFDGIDGLKLYSPSDI